MKIKILFVGILASFILVSCNDPFKGLTTDEKKLVTEIITQMKNDTPRIKKNAVTGAINSNTYYYLTDLFSIETAFDPIDENKAKELQSNYGIKRRTIEGVFPDQMRETGGAPADTRAIWIPTDSLKKFLGALIQYEVKNNQKTGIEIVLGSYRWDAVMDRQLTTGLQRYHQDSVSGRTTVFFVATHDTVSNTKDTYVSRHKAIIPPGSKAAAGINIINHGALCPDSCAITGY